MARRSRDYRDFFAPKQLKVSEKVDTNRWWTLKGVDAANSITATLQSLHNNQSLRLSQMVTSARLYGNLSLVTPFATGLSVYGQFRSSNGGTSSYNIVQSVVDAITSKIAKGKPEPLFLTSGGSFHQQRRAQKLTDYVSGVLYENHGHEMGVQTFRDACVWGSGLVHVFAQNGRVKFERVMPAELYVDELDAFYREPRQLHRVKGVDRLVLIDQFPDHRTDLNDLDPTKLDAVGYGTNTSDMLQVRESWHLPSGPEAKDGRHLITVGEITLFSEDWTHDFFPFAKLDWSPKMYGYWGQGLAEQLMGIQREINQLSWVAQRSFYMAGSYKVFNKIGSKIVKEHLSNEVGAMIDYAGDVPPQYVVPPIISPQHLERIETLKRSAYEQAGISQLSASSQKPAGLNSGKALREMTDIESDRFQVVGQAFEQFFLDLAHLSVSVSREIAETDAADLTVKLPSKKALKSLDWAQCEMDEKDYVTKVFPISALPNEPSGRLQTIQEMIEAGLISPERGRRLLDFPDLAAEESLANAQEEYLHMVLDKIVDDGEYTAPEPQDNLTEARNLALQYYAHGKSSDLEPERLQMLRDFMDQLDTFQQEAMPPPAANGIAPPQAQPMPAPQSDLVPNQAGIAGPH